MGAKTAILPFPVVGLVVRSCPSVLRLSMDTFFELAVVVNFAFFFH